MSEQDEADKVIEWLNSEEDDNHSAWWQDENECRRLRELEEQLEKLNESLRQFNANIRRIFTQERNR